MTVGQLIQQLQQFDPDVDVEGFDRHNMLAFDIDTGIELDMILDDDNNETGHVVMLNFTQLETVML